MKKIYAVATESDVVLAFESRSDADEYAGEHDGMEVLPVPCVGPTSTPARSRPPTGTESPTLCRREASRHEAVHVRMRTLRQGGAGDPGGLRQGENERLRSENKALADNLAEVGRKLADARQRLRSDGPADCKRLRREIETAYEASRERALALTKLDECELWLGRCKPRVTASPTLKGAAQDAAQDAAMPCLKAEEAHGFAMLDVNVEVKAEVTAEKLAKSLREAMKPAMRMAVE